MAGPPLDQWPWSVGGGGFLLNHLYPLLGESVIFNLGESLPWYAAEENGEGKFGDGPKEVFEGLL